jgi:hypothetical protein
MVIEIVRDYQFKDEELIEKEMKWKITPPIFKLSLEATASDTSIALRWSINIVEEKIEVTFFKRNYASSETRILDRDNPNVDFGDYWRPD